jgi:hypothetical protein
LHLKLNAISQGIITPESKLLVIWSGSCVGCWKPHYIKLTHSQASGQHCTGQIYSNTIIRHVTTIYRVYCEQHNCFRRLVQWKRLHLPRKRGLGLWLICQALKTCTSSSQSGKAGLRHLTKTQYNLVLSISYNFQCLMPDHGEYMPETK